MPTASNLGWNYTHLTGAGTTTIFGAIGSAASGSNLPGPVLGSVSTSATGGTLANGPYYYKVTAIVPAGETQASNEQTVTAAGTGISSNTVNWSAVPLATSYRVYRGTAPGAENTFYTVSGTSFLDTGAAGTAGSPPGAGVANSGLLGYVSVNTAGTTVTVNDGAATVAVIGAITGTFLQGPTQMKNGLSVVIAGAADVTVAWA